MSTPGSSFHEPMVKPYAPDRDAKPLWVFGAAVFIVFIAVLIAL